MNDIQCIFCGIGSDQVVIRENGFTGKKCPRCGLIYISPRPGQEEIANLYGHSQAAVAVATHIADEFPHRLYARHQLRLIRQYVRGGDLLEIGAGVGFFLDEARKAGFHPHGLELNPVQAEYMRSRLQIPCEESGLTPAIFGGKQFDLIYHSDVISHLYDPVAEFRGMQEALKPGGWLVFETGNFGDVDRKYYSFVQRFQYPDHLFFFSTGNLADLLKGSGFQLRKIARYSILPQLRFLKLMSRIKPGTAQWGGAGEEKAGLTPAAGGGVKRLVYNAYDTLNYVLRYPIGAIAPKGSRPQTVLVFAQKA